VSYRRWGRLEVLWRPADTFMKGYSILPVEGPFMGWRVTPWGASFWIGRLTVHWMRR